jgi:hypothetical protein
LEDDTLNLEDLLGDVTPSLVTPHLSEISALHSKARPKKIAEYIIRGMANSLKNPVKKELLHEGEIHTIHYVNVEPLCTGSWAMLSLMLLQLSYGEQSTIIDAFYPPNLQLCAKAFAIVFTPELKSNTIIVKQDEQLMDGIESANAGIAMILSLLKHVGTIPHADEINKNRQVMQKLVQTNQTREKYRREYGRSQDAAKQQDGLGK